MLHLLILVLWLFGKLGNIRVDVPSSNHEICAARDQHIILTVVDVYHVQNYVFVLCYHKIFLHYFLSSTFVALSH